MAKNSRTNKTAITVTAFIVVTVLLIAYIGISIWRATWNPIKWINNGTTTTQTKSDGDNPGAIIGDGESNGIKTVRARVAKEDYETYGISPQAEIAETITVITTPGAKYIANKELTWTNSDTSGNVSISSSENDPFTAILTILGGFGQQVTISCTSVANPDLTASFTVDWLKHLKSPDPSSCTDIEQILGTFKMSPLTYDVGSITPDSITCDIVIDTLGTFNAACANKFGELSTHYIVKNVNLLEYVNQELTIDGTILNGKSEEFKTEFYSLAAMYSRFVNISIGIANIHLSYQGVEYAVLDNEKDYEHITTLPSVVEVRKVKNFDGVQAIPLEMYFDFDENMDGTTPGLIFS